MTDTQLPTFARHRHPKRAALPPAPQWYRDAILYEVRLRSFADSDGDGCGDFPGLTAHLDYIEDLGVTAIWLLPFYPSPLRDDGYDISDYTSVHPEAGTLADFQEFVQEAHRRGIRVVTELVLNHTSDRHPWFQRARRAPRESRWRNFYIWSDDPRRYSGARIIFQDFEHSNWAWDPVAESYYWHRFFSHQPDLNFDSPDVRKQVSRILDFWFALGVDGLRLDAVPYLFERDDTNCENLPETHAFLRQLRKHVDARWADRMLLAEANQWPEDAATYFGDGDECHMAFHFPVMPRLFMALQMEDRFPIVEILSQTPSIPENCQWALFLRNHDELTLEMVTDEERDYMYRVYAHDRQARVNLGIRRRLAPLLQNDRRRIELLNALLFSLPGTPVVYYGDEIGMGDNIYLGDRNGVRTPMQWSSDRNAGFSRANPQQLFLPVTVDPEYHYEAINVEAQNRNAHSLLNWMKRLIALRKQHHAFGRGTIDFLAPSNRKVLAFVRTLDDVRILVVANLSRFVEYVELDLATFRGRVPIEMFSRRPFPPIVDRPYLLTLGPHAFYWFELEAEQAATTAVVAAANEPPPLRVEGGWATILAEPESRALEEVLPRILASRRWFGGKAAPITSAAIEEAIPLEHDDVEAVLAFVKVEHLGGRADVYALPVGFVTGDEATRLTREAPWCVLAALEARAGNERITGLLVDALALPAIPALFFDIVARRRRLAGSRGELIGSRGNRFRALGGDSRNAPPARVLKAEQTNTSVAYDEKFVLKLGRRLPEGLSPELEVGRFLSERARFANTAPVAGAIEYRAGRDEPVTVAVLSGYVAHEGDAWAYTVDRAEHTYERILARRTELGEPPQPSANLLDLIEQDPPALVGDLLGDYIESARLLGKRTADLHLALSADPDDPAFAPEPFTSLYQRGRFQSMRSLTARVLAALRDHATRILGRADAAVDELTSREAELVALFRRLVGPPIPGKRIRCHGDYHLGQVLYTGNDFVIIDFEGEPSRPLGERRFKTSPLRDVAGMLRSFDYAAHRPLRDPARGPRIRAEDIAYLEGWARFWRQWVSSSFLRSYLRCIAGNGLIPESREPLERLLRVLILEKNVYEVGYELDHRPDWVEIPVRSILEQLGPRPGGDS